MLAPLNRQRQLLFGGLMMIAWVAIGLPFLIAEEPDAPLVVTSLIGTCSLFVWFLTSVPAEKVMIQLLDSISFVSADIIGFIILGLLFAMWTCIFSLPLFGSWEGRSRQLFLIQNIYAAVQALSYPILEKFF